MQIGVAQVKSMLIYASRVFFLHFLYLGKLNESHTLNFDLEVLSYCTYLII